MSFLKKNIILISLILFAFYGCSTKTTTVHKTTHPRTEATMRPYTIMGKTYYPSRVEVGDTQKGIASWYGPNFHGKSTSNGERYNMYDQTAAHKTYPMNTMVKVTNLNNSKSTIVRINDRGPFVGGRVIDLSKKAANDLGVIATGTAPVKLEVVGFNGHQISKSAPINEKIYTGGNFMVQVGAFRRVEGASIYKQKYNGKNGYSSVVREFQLDGYPIYRVFLTGFRSEEEARDFAHTAHIDGAFIARQ